MGEIVHKVPEREEKTITARNVTALAVPDDKDVTLAMSALGDGKLNKQEAIFALKWAQHLNIDLWAQQGYVWVGQ